MLNVAKAGISLVDKDRLKEQNPLAKVKLKHKQVKSYPIFEKNSFVTLSLIKCSRFLPLRV